MSRDPSTAPRRAAVRDERGVALLVVLMIVALLTITVTEFTYSVQIDAHRTRNALHALQAQLLARSGVNLAEGFLMLDEEPNYDSYSEDWWLQLIEFCKGVQLDDTSRLRCRVRDESGKININNTKEPRTFAQQQGNVSRSAVLRDGLRCMFQGAGIEVEIVDKLADYWQQEVPPGPDGKPGQVPEFTSLEDFGATFGIRTESLQKLRPWVTAQPSGLLRAININTAPRAVLAAVLTDTAPDCSEPSVVADILERQVDIEHPFRNSGEIQSVIQGLDNAGSKRQLFDVRSRLYRLEASAVTNADPSNPERSGGIGQTLSVLVSRVQGGQAPPGGPAIGPSGKPLPNWTLRPLDWQKEGGARLFRSVPTEDENLPGSPDGEEEPQNGALTD